jgi:exopolysaccharide biosynthesis polyprenyl glycosylphosphotransferase
VGVSDERFDAGVSAAVGLSSLTGWGTRTGTDSFELGSLEPETSFEHATASSPAEVHARRLSPPAGGERARLVMAVADAAALAVAMVVVSAARAAIHGAGVPVGAAFGTFERLVVCLPFLVLALGPSRQRFSRSLTTTAVHQVKDVALPLAAATLACVGAWRMVATVAGAPPVPENALLVSCGAGVVMVALTRAAGHGPDRLRRARRRRILVVGSGAVADRIACQLEATGSGEVVGYVDDDPKDPSGCLGPLAQLAELCDSRSVDHIVVAFSRASAEDIVEALRPVQGRLPISVVPRLFDVVGATAGTHDLVSGYPAISVAPAMSGRWQRAAKRTIDIVGAAVALVLGSPVLVVAAVAVRVTSRGPVFLRQVRVGRHGREFAIWKFRTLTVAESVPPPEVLSTGEQVTGPFPKLKRDPRTTAVGRVLRRLSVDEFPQLLNVLLGTMSLVGPRPLAPEYAWNFGPWALRRYDVKPGVTGLWQVSGRNDLTYEEMCRLDHAYVTSWSLRLDAEILARTVRAVVSGRGCY